MKRLSSILLLGALLVAGYAGNASAWSAAACTTISNRASLTFSVGGVDQGTLESSPGGNSTLGVGAGADTDFTVDSRVNLDVIALASPVSATGTDQVLRFRIINLGNDTQRYQLQLFNEAAVDNFDMNNVRVYVDANNNEVYDAGVDTPLASDIGGAGPGFGTNLGLTGDVLGQVGANDNTLAVFVVSDVPAGQTSGNVANYAIKAISYQTVVAGGGISIGADGVGGTEADNSCGNPVVVGDDDTAPSALVTGVNDVARDGADYAAAQYSVVAAGVSVQKTQAVIWDPVNGLAPNAQAIPGAYVRYTITVSNAVGAATATLTQITDLLAAQLAMDPDLATAGSGTFTDALGNGFKVTHTTGRTSLASPRYYTTVDSDAGVGHDGSATAGQITAIFADLLPNVDGYAAGELRANESVTITFNVVIQ